MDKDTAMRYLRSVILESFPAGPDRQRWLAWLAEFSRSEETLQALSERVISEDEGGPLTPINLAASFLSQASGALHLMSQCRLLTSPHS